MEGRKALDQLVRTTDRNVDAIVSEVWVSVRNLPPGEIVAALRASSRDMVRDLVQRIGDGMRGAAEVGSESAAGSLSAATGIEAAALPGSGVADSIAARLIARGGADGLPLSQRLHRMTATYRGELDQAIAAGIRNGDGAFALAQRLHEGAKAGVPPDPALIQEARALIRQMGANGGPEAAAEASRLASRIGEYTRTLEGPAHAGMRPGWEELAKRIERAATTGRAETIDSAVKWWSYDKTQYQAKVIARTEMVDATTRAFEARAEESGLVERLIWRITDDTACEDCQALDGEEFGFGDGERPPLHPNCRCRMENRIDRKAAIERLVSGALSAA